jgi:hypothetical protein
MDIFGEFIADRDWLVWLNGVVNAFKFYLDNYKLRRKKKRNLKNAPSKRRLSLSSFSILLQSAFWWRAFSNEDLLNAIKIGRKKGILLWWCNVEQYLYIAN